MTARRIALVGALIVAGLAPAHAPAAAVEVDESTGLYAYRFVFDLPAARGRYQPELALRSSVTGYVTAPGNGCKVSNTGYGVTWALDLPSLGYDASGLWLNLPRRAKRLMSSGRDGGTYVADVESSYLAVKYPDGAGDTATAVDAKGNKFTFKAPLYATAMTLYLTKVEDPDGNVTRFTWKGGGSNLERIEYNAFGTAAGDRTSTGAVGETGYWGTVVEFTYKAFGGSGVLDAVEVKVVASSGAIDAGTQAMIPPPATRLRRYEFSYGSVDWGWSNTALMGIKQLGLTGGTEREDTSFEWSPANGCLSAVTSPLGARQDIVYLGSDAFGDQAAKSYPVVKSITTSGPALAGNTVSYWYASPQRPAAGDYRGFAQSWSQDAVTKLVRRTTWDVSSRPFMGWPLLAETGTQRSPGTSTSPPLLDAFRTVTSTHAARRINGIGCNATSGEIPSSDYPIVPVSTSEEEETVIDGIRLKSRRTTNCDAVDKWGNATLATIDPDAEWTGDELTVQSTYLPGVEPAPVCKDCVKTRSTWSGSSLKELTQFDHGATSLVTAVRRQAKDGESSHPVVAAYSYYGNGNLASRTEGGATYVYAYDDWFQARVVRVEASDLVDLSKQLVTETAFDGLGRPVKVTGPYYLTSLPFPASLRPERHLGYDGLGRLVFVAKKPLSGTTVVEGLAAFAYTDRASGALLAAVAAYQFAVAKDFVLGAPPTSDDVRISTTYLDGLGRAIQTRERLGGGATSTGAAIVQRLTQYKVTRAIILDGVGRAAAVLEPYFSPSPAYRDLATASLTVGGTEVLKGPVQATWSAYDARGRPTCTTLRAVTTTLPASAPAAGVCTSSFLEDGSYAQATRTTYRGTTYRETTDPSESSRPVLGVKVVEPRFTLPGAVQVGPETFIDAGGLVRRSVDAEGNGVRYRYDVLGRATETVREAPGSAKGTVTSSVTLDMMGRVETRTDPNLGVRTFAYDPQVPGLLESVQFGATGERIRYEYDMGRVKRIRFCSAADVCATESALNWDLPYGSSLAYANTAGRLAWAGNDRATIALSYDDAGAPVRRDQWVGTMGFSFAASRRADGQVTQADFVPAPGLGLPPLTVLYGFDTAARTVQVKAGTSTLWSATAAADGTGAHDAFGSLGTVLVDDGRVQQSWTRLQQSGLLAGQSVTIPGSANPVVYNVTGMTYRGQLLQGYTDTVSQTTHQYWYSNTGRLVAARSRDSVTAALRQLACVGFATNDKFGPGPSFGNIEVVKEGSGALVSKDYTYSGGDIGQGTAGPDAPTSMGTTSITYDVFGRVASRGGGAEAFSYDLAGRLVGVTRSGVQSEALAYDPLGQLVSRTVNGQTTWYLGQQATVTSVAGVLRADVHVAVEGQRVASVRVGGSPRTLYLHRDRLTSVVATTLAGGVRGATYRYGPHGLLESAGGDTGDAASELGYAGAMRLTGGLLLMGARVYDPGARIFLQPDPLAPHDYTYAAGDPINKWDPSGLAPEDSDDPAKRCEKDCGAGGGPPPPPGQPKTPERLIKMPPLVVYGQRQLQPTRVWDWNREVGLLGQVSTQYLWEGVGNTSSSSSSRQAQTLEQPRWHAWEAAMLGAQVALATAAVTKAKLSTAAMVLTGVLAEQAGGLAVGASVDAAVIGGTVALVGAIIGSSLQVLGPAGIVVGAAVAGIAGGVGQAISDYNSKDGINPYKIAAAAGLNALAAAIPGAIVGRGSLLTGLRMANAFAASAAANLSLGGFFPGPRRSRRRRRPCSSGRRMSPESVASPLPAVKAWI